MLDDRWLELPRGNAWLEAFHALRVTMSNGKGDGGLLAPPWVYYMCCALAEGESRCLEPAERHRIARLLASRGDVQRLITSTWLLAGEADREVACRKLIMGELPEEFAAAWKKWAEHCACHPLLAVL